MPATMQLLKLTLLSDLKDRVIDACEIPRNPTDLSRITLEKAQMLYSIIALAVEQEVIQQIDFTPQKNRLRKDETTTYRPTTTKDNCSLSPSQFVRYSVGFMQHLFVNSLQSKVRTKVQLTLGWSRKPMNDLLEIAQHN